MQLEDEVAPEDSFESDTFGEGEDGIDSVPVDTASAIQDVQENQVRPEDLRKEEVSNALSQLEASEQKQEQLQDKVIEALDVAEALEDYHSALCRVKSGSLKPYERRLITLSMESINARLTGSYKLPEAIALESDDGDTFLAKTGAKIVDSLKKIWQWIVMILKKIAAAIYDFMEKIFNFNNVIRNKANALLAATKGMQSSLTPKGVVQFSDLGLLNVNGVPPQSLDGELIYLNVIAKSVYGDVTNWLGGIGQNIVKYLNAATLDNFGPIPVIPTISVPIGQMSVVDKPSSKIGGVVEGTTVVSSRGLLGGKAFVIRSPESVEKMSVEDAARIFPTICATITNDESTPTHQPNTIRNLNIAEINSIATYVIATTDIIDAYHSKSGALARLRDQVIQAAKRIETMIDQNPNVPKTKDLELCQIIALQAPKMIEQPAKEFSAYFAHVANQSLEYAYRSLKLYK